MLLFSTLGHLTAQIIASRIECSSTKSLRRVYVIMDEERTTAVDPSINTRSTRRAGGYLFLRRDIIRRVIAASLMALLAAAFSVVVLASLLGWTNHQQAQAESVNPILRVFHSGR
jgi:hypothetical protein